MEKPMKTQIFLPLMTYPQQTPDTAIDNAAALARHLSAGLHAAVIGVTIPPITDPWSSLLIDTQAMIREAEATSSQQGERLRKGLELAATDASLPLDCETLSVVQPDCDDVVAEIARHYDLTVLAAIPGLESLLHAVIFGSGRPAMLFPDRACTGAIDHVAIAWDGSRAAARALADARPFLAAASKVSVIYALDEKPLGEDPGNRLFAALSAAGVKTDAHAIKAGREPIGEALQGKAVELGADLLVMGAYGHSRMREFILGGATSDVLADPLLPVLMSH